MDDLLVLQQDIPTKDLQIYEICACFWGELYFSSMYIATRDRSDSNLSIDKNSSLTNEYIKTVRSTIYAIKNDKKVYLGILDKMYNFYKSCSFIYATNFMSFLQEFTHVFIPLEFFEKMYKWQKDRILFEIIVKIADKTSINILSPELLSLIIDTHNPSSSTLIRNRFITLIIQVRNEMFKKFISPDEKNNDEKHCTELKKKILEKDKIINKIKDKYDDLKYDYDDLKDEYKQLKNKIKKYEKNNEHENNRKDNKKIDRLSKDLQKNKSNDDSKSSITSISGTTNNSSSYNSDSLSSSNLSSTSDLSSKLSSRSSRSSRSNKSDIINTLSKDSKNKNDSKNKINNSSNISKLISNNNFKIPENKKVDKSLTSPINPLIKPINTMFKNDNLSSINVIDKSSKNNLTSTLDNNVDKSENLDRISNSFSIVEDNFSEQSVFEF
jgi:hypothetical protein